MVIDLCQPINEGELPSIKIIMNVHEARRLAAGLGLTNNILQIYDAQVPTELSQLHQGLTNALPAHRSLLPRHTKVSIHVTDRDRDYNYDAARARITQGTGVVIGFSDSHGLCYHVLHDAPYTTPSAWYDPDELTPL